MHQAISREDEIETFVVEGEVGRVALLEGDAPPHPILRASDLKKSKIWIKPDAFTINSHESSQQFGCLSESAPDIKPPAARTGSEIREMRSSSAVEEMGQEALAPKICLIDAVLHRPLP
jgi:hypothetical protein